jgi:hypothetical protein
MLSAKIKISPMWWYFYFLAQGMGQEPTGVSEKVPCRFAPSLLGLAKGTAVSEASRRPKAVALRQTQKYHPCGGIFVSP